MALIARKMSPPTIDRAMGDEAGRFPATRVGRINISDFVGIDGP